ncbi:hypothetical protein GOODEAATRI_012060 [Goodea atripinnis]|uniref:Uncharacterized protein n=1 Tax=Goodea atripinnis TaxID=208336 RepID=A0ABV0N237_9TELE
MQTGLFYTHQEQPPSNVASHLLVSFREPGPLLRLLSGPIRALTGRGASPVKSHLSALPGLRLTQLSKAAQSRVARQKDQRSAAFMRTERTVDRGEAGLHHEAHMGGQKGILLEDCIYETEG